MKKVNLMDIMESLDSGDQDAASTALHEWFVGQAAQAHRGISGGGSVGQVEEADDAFAAMQNNQVQGSVKPAMPNGDPATDAAGWLYLAQKIAYTFDASGAEDEMQEQDLEEVQDCAMGAAASFREGDVATGVSALLPSANAQDYLINFDEIPEAYQQYLFHGPTSESMVDEGDVVDATDRFAARRAPQDIQPAEPNGDVANDAAGWMTIAKQIITTSRANLGHAEDDMVAEDIEEVITCAKEALNLFNRGDVAGGVEALLPSANAQDYLPDFDAAYHDYLFHGAQAASESVHESEEVEEDETVEESAEPTFESLMAELSESFNGLETVSDKLQNQEGAQVGEQGKVPVNTKGTLPNRKGAARLAGEPVEIKGKGHTGHARETAPKVTDVKLKGNVQNSKDDPKKVSAPKGAILNKMDGSVNTQSPISGKGAKGLKK